VARRKNPNANIKVAPVGFAFFEHPATVSTSTNVGPMAREMALAEDALRRAQRARKRKPVDPESDLRFFRLHTSGGGAMSYGKIALNDPIAIKRKMTRANVIDAVKRARKRLRESK
jgi:hypothetical protein